MLKLSREDIKDTRKWKDAGIELPQFDVEAMVEKTSEDPAWIHFGAGNIFRGFIAVLQQDLLNMGKAGTGIVAVGPRDSEIMDKIFAPYDALSLLVVMKPDGSVNKKVVASITEGLVGDPGRKKDWEKLKSYFTRSSLQMVSFTITEKGYSLTGASGDYLPEVKEDLANGPAKPGNIMSKVTSLAYTRFKNGKFPIAFVSMDNCSHNGDKLRHAIVTIAEKWVKSGLVESEFLDYIKDTKKVSFPWTMIDKITPRPAETVKNALNAIGFESTEIVCTSKKTYVAPFVNAEEPQYLIVEDDFPNGRMPLELAGVLFTDKQTVDRVEKMKVCTCLNPLHTALAVYGCTLGYELIADEMKDPQLKKLVEKIGYEEGLLVVVNPGIINPADFIREVIEVRFPNPFIPDTPQRIATDTSQKVGIRFGETIKAYAERPDLNPANLKYIPLALAGWLRYLLGVDDSGKEMALSPDPMLEVLKSKLSGIKLGDISSVGDSLKPILSDEKLFGVDLYSVGLGEKVEGYFTEMISGKGAVRSTLQKYLN